MVVIVENKQGNVISYYLHHTFRDGKNFKSIKKYIGKKIPKDIDNLKIEFFMEVYSKFFKEIELFKDKYQKHLKKIPKSILEKEQKDFSTKFTYNTNRIEGSTLTLKDTANLIEEHIVPEKKLLRDVKETESHYKVFFELMKKEKKITYNNILKWHNDIFKDTKPDMAGKLRDYQVGISQSKFLPPSPVEVYSETKQFFRWFESKKEKYHPLVLSALSHLKFVTVHPFGDGNGRLSRIIMNIVLNNEEYPLYIIDYKDRNGYYNALEKSQVNNNEIKFLTWFVRNYFKFIKSQSKLWK
jgi:Fic family protein